MYDIFHLKDIHMPSGFCGEVCRTSGEEINAKQPEMEAEQEYLYTVKNQEWHANSYAL